MPSWWTYWEIARSTPADQQRALFREHVVGAHPEAFAENVVSTDSIAAFDLDARIDALLTEVEPLVPVMRRLSDEAATELPRHRATFAQAFPDFEWDGRVYFTVSLLAFDGAVREVGGKPALFFGIDKIAKLHGDAASLAPLFHHELFHVYHLVTCHPFDEAGGDRIYQALWGEGLAVYVAKQLNPGASAAQLVLSDEMVAEGTAKLPAIAAELRANLDAGDEAFYRDFFRGAGQREDIPLRVGYFVGLRVAEVLGKGRSLRELAHLADPELRQEIERALRELEAAGSSAVASSSP